jgi:iron complex transport system substrate-binding protein
VTTFLLERPLGRPDIVDDLTRRELISGATALFVLAACGRSDDRASDAGGAPEPGFPVEVTGALGTIKLARRPERVVAVGFLRDPDIAVALDVVPAGIARQTFFADGLSPWLVEALRSARPRLLEGETINLEEVAGLKPTSSWPPTTTRWRPTTPP